VWGSRCIEPRILDLEVSGELNAPACLLLGKEPLLPNWIGGWMGPGTCLDEVERTKIMPYLDPSAVHPLSSRYEGKVKLSL
jgi:hypothetical protein